MYHFRVDDRPYKSQHSLLSVAEIKGIADVPYNHNLLCRLQKLRDDERIEVDGKEFYSAPQAYW